MVAATQYGEVVAELTQGLPVGLFLAQLAGGQRVAGSDEHG